MSLRGGSGAEGEEEEEAEELPVGGGGTLATISASSCGAAAAFPCSSRRKEILGPEGSLEPRVRVGLLLVAASSATVLF